MPHQSSQFCQHAVLTTLTDRDGSNLTFLELCTIQLGAGAIELLRFCSMHGHGQLYLMRPHNSHSKAGLLPPAQSMEEKIEWVCSSVQTDAEIITATANFHPKPRLKGDPVSASFVSTTQGLSSVWNFFLLSFILPVQHKQSIDAFCSYINSHLVGCEEKPEAIATCIKTVHPVPSPHHCAILEAASLQTANPQIPSMIHRRVCVCKHQCWGKPQGFLKLHFIQLGFRLQ